MVPLLELYAAMNTFTFNERLNCPLFPSIVRSAICCPHKEPVDVVIFVFRISELHNIARFWSMMASPDELVLSISTNEANEGETSYETLQPKYQ